MRARGRQAGRQTPRGHAKGHARWPKPAELAKAIHYLISPDNTATSGTIVPVYGRS